MSRPRTSAHVLTPRPAHDHAAARELERRRAFGRRRFLRGAGGVAVALPFLELFGPRPASAGPDAAPLRFLTFIHPQGTIWNQWSPVGGEQNFTLTPVLEPLSAEVANLLFISGVGNRVINLQHNTNGHNGPGRSLLTAHTYAGNLDAEGNLLPDDQHVGNDHAAGPSVDQVIAQQLAAPTPYESLNFGVGGSSVGEYQMLFAGPSDPVSLDGDPQQVFDKLFSIGDPMEPSTLDRIRSQRKSVLDAVDESFTQLDARLGAADRQRLEAHAEKIREIEKALDNTGQPGIGCATPTIDLPPGYTPQSDGGLWDNASSRAFIDLMVMALACDLTRVGTLQYTNYHGPIFPWLGQQIPGDYDSWHTWVHGAVDPSSDPVMIDVFRWYMQELAYLVEQLAATPEGDSTLLDHMLVFATSEFDNGAVHSGYSLPIILAGNLCGAVTTGRAIERDAAHNDLYTALIQLYGGEQDCFGLEQLCDGPLVL